MNRQPSVYKKDEIWSTDVLQAYFVMIKVVSFLPLTNVCVLFFDLLTNQLTTIHFYAFTGVYTKDDS